MVRRSFGPTRAHVSGLNVQSLKVIDCNDDETNVTKVRNPHNDDDDRYTSEGIVVDDVSVPRK